MRSSVLQAVVLAAGSLLAAACADESAREAASAWFSEEGRQRGIDFVYRSGFAGTPRLPEIVGGGAALADVDGDGDLDAYLVQGGTQLEDRSGGADGPANQLYLNRGDGHFEPAPEPGDAADRGYGMGVAAGDYDGDGDVDLYVTNLGPNALLRNDGGGRFTNVARAAGVDHPGWGTAALFADFDGDGDLDLFAANYLDWTPGIERACSSRGKPTYCAPTAYDAPAVDVLYRNDGGGRFTDVTVLAGLSGLPGNGLGALAADFDNDGLVDLFVANDRMLDRLWMNRGNMAFRDEAARRGVAMDDSGIAKAGMGVAAADIDDDGDEDLLVVNFAGESDSFYENQGEYFVDVTARAGIAVASRKRTRFGVLLADLDNDGRVDLFEANGKVDGDPRARPDAFAEPNALFRGVAAAGPGPIGFAAVGGEPGSVLTSRAAAIGDVDGDGGLDILIVNREGPAQLLMNRAAWGRGWIGLHVLTGAGGPALGARVALRVDGVERWFTVRSASSYLAAHEARVHVGLGAAPRVEDVRVRWPDGRVQAFGDYPAGRNHVLRRGADAVGHDG